MLGDIRLNRILKTYEGYKSHKRHGVRCEINTPDGSYPLHHHDYFEIEIIEEGRILHELNGVREELGRGEIFALSPGDLHRFTVLEPVRILSFCVFYKDAPSVVQKMISAAKFPLRASVGDPVLAELKEYFKCAVLLLDSGGEFERERIGAYATLFLSEVIRSSRQSESARSAGGYGHIARAMKYISENFTQPITLEAVAEQVHLTPSYFSKLFTEINGGGFVKYLTEKRVEQAKELLSSTDMSVTDIAFACGFGSFSSFSRSFGALCGVTPNEYRKYAKTS